MISELTAINPTQTTSNTTGKQKVNEDVFFQILNVELQNQNPLDPMDNSQWLGQLSQMQSLEQTSAMAAEIKEMKQSLGFFQAASMVGKEIEYKDTDGKTLSGQVNSVTQKNNQIYLNVADQEVTVEQIVRVGGAEND